MLSKYQNLSKSLNTDNIVISSIEQGAIENHFVTASSKQDEFCSLKKGIKLPNLPKEWHLASLYFHSELSSINIKNNLNEAMSLVKLTVCNYFRDNYGYENTISEEEIALKRDINTSLRKIQKRN